MGDDASEVPQDDNSEVTPSGAPELSELRRPAPFRASEAREMGLPDPDEGTPWAGTAGLLPRPGRPRWHRWVKSGDEETRERKLSAEGQRVKDRKERRAAARAAAPPPPDPLPSEGKSPLRSHGGVLGFLTALKQSKTR